MQWSLVYRGCYVLKIPPDKQNPQNRDLLIFHKGMQTSVACLWEVTTLFALWLKRSATVVLLRHSSEVTAGI